MPFKLIAALDFFRLWLLSYTEQTIPCQKYCRLKTSASHLLHVSTLTDGQMMPPWHVTGACLLLTWSSWSVRRRSPLSIISSTTHSFIMFLTCVQLEYRNQLVSFFISHGLIIACTCSMYSVTALYWYDVTTVHVTPSRFFFFFFFLLFFFFLSIFLFFFRSFFFFLFFFHLFVPFFLSSSFSSSFFFCLFLFSFLFFSSSFSAPSGFEYPI